MKIIVLLSTLTIAVLVSGCDLRTRPQIPEIKSELDKILKLESVNSSAGVGGTRGSDKIQTDQEDSLWIIPLGADASVIHDQLKDSVIAILRAKGAEVVSSGSGASHGYANDYLHYGGNVSSHTFIYRYNRGLGFIDVFMTTYKADKESGRIGINHIFIPHP